VVLFMGNSCFPSGCLFFSRYIFSRTLLQCPCVEHHLVGCKKVQQQLSLPGQLERFVDAEEGAALRKVPCGHVGRCHDPALDRDKVQDRLHRCTCKMRCCVIFQSAPL
jgi:hypothetical protein